MRTLGLADDGVGGKCDLAFVEIDMSLKRRLHNLAVAGARNS